jgi:hypothetical protein
MIDKVRALNSLQCRRPRRGDLRKERQMTSTGKIWFITGISRGLGKALSD